MTENDVMLQVVDALDKSNIPYMLVGAFSSNCHGIPRSTEDVDLVIELNSPITKDFDRLLGNSFAPEQQLSFETNTGTHRSQEYVVTGTVFKVEIFRLSDDPFDQLRFHRRKVYKVGKRDIWMPTPEDVIVWKLRWGRAKDKEDVKGIMYVQRGNLDWPYIEQWCSAHGSLALMERIRSSIPQI